MSEPFRFHTRLNLVELLGRRASTVRELLTGIREVPGASIYHHTHRFLQQHHFLSPEPPNDFAYWISGSLGLNDIGERLASIDTVRYRRINDLRTRYVEILEEALAARRNSWPVCQESDEFHFMSCRTFIIPLPAVARDAGEFLDILGRISVNSLYYHVFESRLRLERGGERFRRLVRGAGGPRTGRCPGQARSLHDHHGRAPAGDHRIGEVPCPGSMTTSP